MYTRDESINIEIVSGGYILTYPTHDEYPTHTREIFTQPRKMFQKISEVLDILNQPVKTKPVDPYAIAQAAELNRLNEQNAERSL